MRDKAVLLLGLGWSSKMSLGSNFTSSIVRKKLKLSYIDLHKKTQFKSMFRSSISCYSKSLI